MEFLMTYGWAILILAIVIIALIKIGLFSNNLAPRAQPGNCFVSQSVPGGTLEGTCNGELPEFVAQFNGATSYISFSPPTYTLTAATASVWVMTTGNNGAILQLQGQPNPLIYLEVGATTAGGAANQLVIYLRNDGGVGVIPWNTGTVINNGVWNFVAVSWNGQNAVAYVNGAQVATTAFSGTLTMSLTPAGSIGGLFGLYGLNSEISNVKIYNASLPASDIQTLYMEGIGGAPVDTNYLFGWWPLNGNTNDYSGNNNNGVPTSVTYSSSWISSYTQP